MKIRLLGLAMQILVMAIIISVMLLILGIGVLVMIRVCTIRRGLRRNAGGGESESRERASHVDSGLSHDDLEKLPCYNYAVKDSNEHGSVECAVCLENFRAGERCRLLPVCKHSFHAECIDSWLLKASICPLCRSSAGNFVDKDATQWQFDSADISIAVAPPVQASGSE